LFERVSLKEKDGLHMIEIDDLQAGIYQLKFSKGFSGSKISDN